MHATLDKLYRTMEQDLRNQDAAALQRHPEDDPTRWSGQQIVEHLLLTYTLSAANFETRLAKGTATAAKASLAQRFGQFYICTLGLFPPGRKSPAIAEPPSASVPQSGAALLEQVDTQLHRFDDLAARGERHFGPAAAFTHPILGPMNAARWRQFHSVHGLHHMRQIRSLTPVGHVS